MEAAARKKNTLVGTATAWATQEARRSACGNSVFFADYSEQTEGASQRFRDLKISRFRDFEIERFKDWPSTSSGTDDTWLGWGNDT
ncbi:hypothetical protein [Flavobacterium sp.]|uniref:hypothetical protein n=1 Tax=Flavobacterium sp. TaxID=239 RepID=UPI003B9D0CC7